MHHHCDDCGCDWQSDDDHGPWPSIYEPDDHDRDGDAPCYERSESLCAECFQARLADVATARREREAAELASFRRRDEWRQATCRAVEAALGIDPAGDDWNGWSGAASQYATWRGLTIRVSDHEQPTDGGFRVCNGELGRHGAADVSLVMPADGSVPSRQEIRSAVAAALRAVR